MPAHPLRAGAATSNITPALGCSINGGMTDRQARHIHDELHARALVLDDGRTQLALVVCDSCALPGAVIDAAKHLAHGHTGIPPAHMLVSATHTHSAPTAVAVFQSEPDAEYAAFLILRIADAIRRASNNLAPARIAWGSGSVPAHVFNRRWRMKPGTIPPNPFGRVDEVQMNPPVGSPNLVEPAGPTDPQLSLLAVVGERGEPLAVLANYSLHYVGGVPAEHISADYFGAFAVRLGELLGVSPWQDPPFVGIMSNGTSGNINNIDFLHPRPPRAPYEQIRLVAGDVAAEAHRVFQMLTFRDDVVLGARECRMALERRLPTADELAEARRTLAAGEGMPLTTLPEIYARETLLMAELPAQVETVVQVLRVGELGIAALPCEVFVETGLLIKQHSPLPATFVISLANDYAGYLPTPEHHRLGGYETWRARSSFLEVDAEPKLRGRALELMAALA
jgi:hypothetical protein